MGLGSILAMGLVAVIAARLLHINKADTPLPYPHQWHSVVDLDPTNLPLTPLPFEGPLAKNTLLRRAHKLFDGVIHAAETPVISPDGKLLTLIDKYGFIYEAEGADPPNVPRLTPNPVAYLGAGRPLGAAYDAAGNLVVCDAVQGLLLVDRVTRTVTILSNRVSNDSAIDPGAVLTFCNDLDIASDGTIYFTTSQDVPIPLSTAAAGKGGSTRSYYHAELGFFKGLLAGSKAGRLLKYDPTTRTTEVLLNDLWYANGVALSKDESFVAVNDGNRARILRYYLEGPKAGTSGVLLANLPGYADGIGRASDGGFWLALVAPMQPIAPLLKYKVVRALLAHFPSWATPPADKWGGVLKIDAQGRPQRLLLDPDGSHIAYVSAVAEHRGRLYLGNVDSHYVSYVDLSDLE